MPKKRAPKIRYSKKLAQFIVDKLQFESIMPQQLHKKFPDMPHPKTIYRWQAQHPEFKEQMDEAYTEFFMSLTAEINELSNKPATTLYPECDFKEAEATARRRLDALKFMLGKLSAVLSARFDKTTKVEHSGDVQAPQIVIQSYAAEDSLADFTDKGEKMGKPKRH